MIYLKYHFADNGNCRVYYKSSKSPKCLYCWQSVGRVGDFELLVCSRDGEPSHRVGETRYDTEPPKGDELIEDELRTFLGVPDEGVAMSIEQARKDFVRQQVADGTAEAQAIASLCFARDLLTTSGHLRAANKVQVALSSVDVGLADIDALRRCREGCCYDC